jgi:hypothetical protein
MNKRIRLTVCVTAIALAFSFTGCLVANPGDYQRSDRTSTTSDSPVGNSTMEDGHVHP